MPDGVLRIAQLNMGSLLEPGWDERRHGVVAWLDRLEPDVVCLQEAWESPTDECTSAWVAGQAQGEWHHSFGGHPLDPRFWGGKEVTFGSAVLSRWPIERTHLWALPVPDTAEPMARSVPWELLHAETAGLDVFSMHLAAAPHWGDIRCDQVLAVDDHVRAVRGTKDQHAGPGTRRRTMPPILCGDANAEPDSDEIRWLCGLTTLGGRTTFWQDAWRVAGDGGPGLTQDWRTNDIAAFLNVHRKRIDYVFVGDPFLRDGHAGRVLEARVAFDDPMVSDHAGLVVDVVWPDRPS